MYIHSAAEYQHALEKAEALQSKGTSNLTKEEKDELNKIIRAIESYHFRNDPVSALAMYA